MTGNEKSSISLPDYVPAPNPATADRMIGVHYFPGWKPGVHRGWSVLKDFPERKPVLGYYDESNPEVTDWEIKWALEHGISFFLYCWYRKKENAGQPVTVDALHLGHAIHEGLFRSRYASHMTFAIMWENYGTRGMIASLDDLKDNLFPFWLEHYFSRSNYLRFGNTPVLCVYHMQSLFDQTGGEEGAKKALDIMRTAAVKAGFDDLYVMCEHRGVDEEFLLSARRVGFNGAFAYCWHTKDRFPSIVEAMDNQLEKMSKWREYGILPFPPTATVGWDPMPWSRDDDSAPWLNRDKITRWYLTPTEYEALLRRVKAFADSFPSDSLMRRMLLIDNWNEWGEGHFVSPHAAAGFGYLQAIWNVFTLRDNIPYHGTPSMIGLGPYGPADPE